MEVKEKRLSRWTPTIVTVLIIVFNIGYTVKELQSKPSKEEVQQIVKSSIEEDNLLEVEKFYSKTDGTVTKTELESIKQQLDRIEKKLDRLK